MNNQHRRHSCPSTGHMQISNCALAMSSTADGDAVNQCRCQVLGRAGSVHHGADESMFHDLPDGTVTRFWFGRVSAFNQVRF